ncbi:hypothetical protein [Ferruginibacter sp.]
MAIEIIKMSLLVIIFLSIAAKIAFKISTRIMLIRLSFLLSALIIPDINRYKTIAINNAAYNLYKSGEMRICSTAKIPVLNDHLSPGIIINSAEIEVNILKGFIDFAIVQICKGKCIAMDF